MSIPLLFKIGFSCAGAAALPRPRARPAGKKRLIRLQQKEIPLKEPLTKPFCRCYNARKSGGRLESGMIGPSRQESFDDEDQLSVDQRR